MAQIAAVLGGRGRSGGALFYVSVTLLSASLIAYEISIMRVFAVGSWSHFASMTISIAMFGFTASSTIICIFKDAFKKNLEHWMTGCAIGLGPALAVANTLAQTLDFKPIFIISDGKQKTILFAYYVLYFAPFFIGATFLGLAFIKGQTRFGVLYFANMAGSGAGGFVTLVAMYFLLPEHLLFAPLLLWLVGTSAWLYRRGSLPYFSLLVLAGSTACATLLLFPQVRVSPYKGVSYARKFPDARKVYHAASPRGYLEVYDSSYFHFAPGLSDTASLELSRMPEHAFLGMYIDGDGPVGVMRDLPDEEAEYLRFLPMAMPYLLMENPAVLVLQFGGGISTQLALKAGASRVVVAEGNPLILAALANSRYISSFSGDILRNPKLAIVPVEGHIYVRKVAEKFDLVDLSLADSTGLSMPTGFAVHENYTYTVETLRAAMTALSDRGVLSVTVWNKQDPPKSTLKLLATLVRASLSTEDADPRDNFFVVHQYLSTLSVLCKKNGFSRDEIDALRAYNRRMSFEVIYFPGMETDTGEADELYAAYKSIYFDPSGQAANRDDLDLSSSHLYRVVFKQMVEGQFGQIEKNYVFNNLPLSDDRPYFSGFIRLGDIPRFIDKLESVSDDWGYLLLWATLLQALLLGLLLLSLPALFAWRAVFSKSRGKGAVMLYFCCLGLGYMLVEIVMISRIKLFLGSPTISAALLVVGMLIFSGIGSFFTDRIVRPRKVMARVCLSIVLALLLFMFYLDNLLIWIALWPFSIKLLICSLLMIPLAFPMGFPFAIGMSALSQIGQEHLFVWAWGINGAFSVIGSVLAPILSIIGGHSAVMMLAAFAYILGFLAFNAFARDHA